MALDVGARTIGVAVSDPLKITARPLTTLVRAGLDQDVEALLELAASEKIEKLIVGKPRHLGGEESAVMALISPLVDLVAKKLSIPVEWAEERLSTKTAEDLMSEAGLSPSQRRRRKHEFSAAVILQWYLQEGKAVE